MGGDNHIEGDSIRATPHRRARGHDLRHRLTSPVRSALACLGMVIPPKRAHYPWRDVGVATPPQAVRRLCPRGGHDFSCSTPLRAGKATPRSAFFPRGISVILTNRRLIPLIRTFLKCGSSIFLIPNWFRGCCQLLQLKIVNSETRERGRVNGMPARLTSGLQVITESTLDQIRGELVDTQ